MKLGETPEDWSAKKLAHKDVDARWTEKHGKQTCGYKLIRTVHVSPANEGDQTHLLKVLNRSKTSRDLYADRGYTALDFLKARGWQQHIQRRTRPKQALSETQAGRNRSITKIRLRVENPFAGLCALGGKFLRSVGLLISNLAIASQGTDQTDQMHAILMQTHVQDQAWQMTTAAYSKPIWRG
ncbi:transposase [Crenobacter intestini]|uniref:Transposase n=1 Tax=Crenobacter intestini TaxID=2563443 RepID=A0A4T0UJQ3_9NEIS|nr:transposase [Crenobacter intestini]TIC78541.1 transposase [Crenobacter intestini]